VCLLKYLKQVLKELEAKKVAPDVVARLEQVLKGQDNISESSIKTALFSDNNPS